MEDQEAASGHKDVFQCGVCSQTWQNFEGFLNHRPSCSQTIQDLNLVPEVLPDLNEEVQELEFLPSNDAIRTERTIEVRPEKLQKPGYKKLLICRHCGKMFRKTFDYNNHIRIHTGEKPFLCPICGKTFNQKSNLKKHQNSHKTWTQRTTPLLETEIITNDSKRYQVVVKNSYQCPYCQEVCQEYHGFVRHMKIHSDRKVAV